MDPGPQLCRAVTRCESGTALEATWELRKSYLPEFLSKLRVACNCEVAKTSGTSTKKMLRHIKALLNEGLLEHIGTKNSPKRRYRLS